MKVEDSLKSMGWHLSPEWTSENLANDHIDKIVKLLLDEDIRKVGISFISDEIVKEKSGWTFKSNCVFQVHKVTNVAAPKANEECGVAPKLLQVLLTDGSQNVPALDLNSIPSLSLNTAPGTKLRIKAGQLSCLGGFLVLQKSSVEILGGTVAALLEKWQISRSLAKYNRSNWASSGVGGPPPWVPFGQKIAPVDQDGKFKSFGDSLKEKDNDDFEQQRKANIDEISKTKLGGRKVFGGGKAVVTDNRVYEENYNARQANKVFRGEGPRERGRGQGRRGRRGGGRGGNDNTDDVVASAPSKPQTLFDFLESKMSDMTLKTVKSEKVGGSTYAAKPYSPSFQNSYQVSNAVHSGPSYTTQRPSSESYYKVSNAIQSNLSANSTQRPINSSRSPRPSQSLYQVPKATQSNSAVEVPQLTVRLDSATFNDRHQQNPGGPAEEASKTKLNWKSGDKCLAQYWEDNKYYPASIHAVAPNGATCVVCFSQFGNYEEVLLEHVKPQFSRGGGNFNRPGRGRQSTTFYRSKQSS